jgi:leucyl aminopeptidase
VPRETGGNRAEAAHRLDIDIATLSRELEQYRARGGAGGARIFVRPGQPSRPACAMMDALERVRNIVEMLRYLTDAPKDEAIPLTLVSKAGLSAWIESQDEITKTWIAACGFTGEADSFLRIPGPGGKVARVLCGAAENDDLWSLAALPAKLGRGTYRLDAELDRGRATQLCTGWALGTYRFQRYKPQHDDAMAALVWPASADRDEVARTAGATALVRDLVNTPANDLGPAELAEAAIVLGDEHGAQVRVIVGDDLLSENYPTIHAVGRGSERPPRLVDLRWQPHGSGGDLPRVTVVGKGVVFDSGGLDLKPSASMKLMKKDMGGAAHALGLCRMIMMAGLPVRLRLLIPAVENSVSGSAFRPLDVLKTRKGLTVEVGNTDAEGRLVLCDALAEACTESPDLLIDFATLTGAARVALGTDIAVMFCNQDALAEELQGCSVAESDPMWRLPLYRPYAKGLASKVADTNSIAEHGFAGAIVAALFLEKFVPAATPWVHLDIFGWNNSARPGRPVGGEAFGIRSAFRLVRQRFGRG